MPLRQARDRRNAAVRSTASTLSHSSSFIRTNRLSRVTPALLTRMSSPPIAASAAGTSASTAAESARSHGSDVGALAELGGERLERLAPRAGERDTRALAVQRAGDRAAEAADAPVTSAFASQIEHGFVSTCRVSWASRAP